MESIWNNTVKKPQFESLKGTVKTDVLVIGGGMCGLLCGYMLKSAGVDCIVAEAEKICGGVTGYTTAKVTCQHGLIYDKIIEKYGEENARLYFESQKNALDKYRELSKGYECDFTECDFYVYSLNDREKIEKEVRALDRIGYNAEFTEKTELPFEITGGAVKMKKQAQFNPLKFAYSIAKETSVYENTKIVELRPDCVVTNHGKIIAEKIIVATHFPFINKHGGYFLKLYQHRSYVMALKDAPEIKNMYVDESMTGLSFRSYNGLLLLGGGSHRTGKSGGNWEELEKFAKQHYPDAQVVGNWATQDCMTLDSIPYIGQYSKNTPNLYVATGFNKWGMTSSMTAAMVLCDLVQEKENKYQDIFLPSRSILHPQLAVNTVESLIGLLTPTAPRCPHMGCALKYNKQERSWDCPCHGSRFTENGKLINNPSTDDKNMER